MSAAAPLQRAQESLDLLMGLAQAARAIRAADGAREAIGLTVVAGFLGAGKTTLMRHVLSAPHGLKVAAVVNDVAALNVDADWVAAVHEDTLELSNGCVCCGAAGQLANCLMGLAQRASRPDVILLEASGVGSLASIAQMVAVLPGIRLDCKVCIVDASAPALPPEVQEAQDAHIRAADLVLLNKSDISTKEQLASWVHRVGRLAPRAHLLQTHGAAVPAPLLFHAAHPQREPMWGQAHGVMPAFDSVVLRASAALPRQALAQVLTDMPAPIMRCKGWVWLAETPTQGHAVQSVGRRWSWQPQSDAPPHSRLVCIGLAKDNIVSLAAAHFAPLGFVPEPPAEAAPPVTL